MANLTATNFDRARTLLAAGGPKVRVIGNNTTIEVNTYSDEDYGTEPVILVRLHGHGIVLLFANGDVAVRDCGYVTTTTYDRINAFLPAGYGASRRGGSGTLINRRTNERQAISGQQWVRVAS
jgi:hypothetical protein